MCIHCNIYNLFSTQNRVKKLTRLIFIKMECKNINYETRKTYNSYNLNNYGGAYFSLSSGEESYMNCIKYGPKLNSGDYLPLK